MQFQDILIAFAFFDKFGKTLIKIGIFYMCALIIRQIKIHCIVAVLIRIRNQFSLDLLIELITEIIDHIIVFDDHLIDLR